MLEGFIFRRRCQTIREPKSIGPVEFSEGTEQAVASGLASLGIPVKEFIIDAGRYNDYFRKAGYLEKYPGYYRTNIHEKSLEHFIASELLDLKKGDVYIDIASENSPVPEIYGGLFGCRAYRQDLSYPEGLQGDRIGGDAANMPVPEAFADKMALHCSFEHFEGNADVEFTRELSRVLKKGGKCCIVPLYMSDRYAVQTDPVACGGVEFEQDAVVNCAKGWGNRHGRFYDPAHFKARIFDNLGAKAAATLYRVTNAKKVDPSCYVRFALLIEKVEA